MGSGGADPDRTGDPLLAKQVLSQLSYSPEDTVFRCWMRDVSGKIIYLSLPSNPYHLVPVFNGPR